MTHGSLFSGIEGFTEGANRAGGITTLFHVEENRFCHAIIRKSSDAPIYGDIRQFDGNPWRNRVDVLSGGFPCQDISHAGKRVGIAGENSGLWKHFARLIQEIGPRWVLIENSSNLTRKGLEVVLHDLAKIGYDAEWEHLHASAFGMPHERERIFLIAYPNQAGWAQLLHSYPTSIFSPISQAGPWETGCQPATSADPVLFFSESVCEPALWRMDDGVRARQDLMPRLAAIGNSVSPVITEYLFHCIKWAQEVSDKFLN